MDRFARFTRYFVFDSENRLVDWFNTDLTSAKALASAIGGTVRARDYVGYAVRELTPAEVND